MRFAIVALALAAFAGCEPSVGKEGVPVREDLGVGIYRYHDDYAGVTCWTYKSGYAGGISCLPDHQLKGVP
jgi:hypothetical protein